MHPPDCQAAAHYSQWLLPLLQGACCRPKSEELGRQRLHHVHYPNSCTNPCQVQWNDGRLNMLSPSFLIFLFLRIQRQVSVGWEVSEWQLMKFLPTTQLENKGLAVPLLPSCHAWSLGTSTKHTLNRILNIHIIVKKCHWKILNIIQWSTTIHTTACANNKHRTIFKAARSMPTSSHVLYHLFKPVNR